MGLIPAHAGKTNARRRRAHRPRAHPRSRGENPSSRSPVSAHRGSSPLTRGKQFPLIFCAFRPGLIPAHAGKTPGCFWPAMNTTAHPRSRGENRMIAGAGVLVLGSSPLTRGKQDDCGRGSLSTGLIPAHAGKTSGSRIAFPATRAHPRSRGENLRARPRNTGSCGSSPLTRGKRGS